MKFHYFRDPDNFAYRVSAAVPCSICAADGLWFDASGFIGANEIECICDQCLVAGKLESLGIETNEAYGGIPEQTKVINYRTPALPTWQDRTWPAIDGEYCVFERFASKADFEHKGAFFSSLSDEDRENSDVEWL